MRHEDRLMFPNVTTTTAGVILILQILLAFTVSGGRGKVGTWVGAGGHGSLERAIRRHGNLAENGGIFVAGFLLLELSRFSSTLLVSLCAGFVAVRLFHVAGISRENTNNPFRIIGGVGTYLIGLTLGGTLVWVGSNAAIRSMQ